MSHDLSLLATMPADREALAASLLARRHWRRAGDALEYENPDTGVYATADGLDVGASGTDPAGPLVSLNYVRPKFFALEVVPQVVDAARAAGVLIVDPQDDAIGGSGQAKEPDVDELVRSWEAGNRVSIAYARSSGATLPTMDPALALGWWRFMRAKADLTERFGQTHYVPGVRLVRRPPSLEVLRLLTWTDWIPLVLPEVDVVAVLRSKGTTFEIRGILPFDAVHRPMTGLLRQVTLGDDLELDILDPGGALLVSEILGPRALEPFAGFEAVAPDGFVDSAA